MTGTKSAFPTAIHVATRRIGWGDTDAARIVFTGRIPEIGIAAIETWFIERLGQNWFEMEDAVSTPCVYLEFDFKAPMTPRDTLKIAVLLERAGPASLTFRLIARAEADDRLFWQARFVFAAVDMQVFVPATVPQDWRAALDRELALTAAADPRYAWTTRPSQARS